ncbi:MAG: AgmX/PglI C-terminal domain-containing protein [Myxococcales bacterium]|nr:AgmX/PglI C-terminal domain-containing protein [Myxococcales bacterium]
MPNAYLRCALVWQNTLLEEHMFAPPARVKVGDRAGTTFAISAPGLGKSHLLFDHGRGGCRLFLKDGILGRLRIAGRIREVEEMLRDPELGRSKDGSAVCDLAEGDGGVLVFGQAGLLFQFVRELGEVERSRLSATAGTDSFMNRVFGAVLGVVLLFSFASRLFASAPQSFTVEQLPDRIVSYVIEDPEAARNFREELDRRREEQKKELRQAAVEQNRPERARPRPGPEEDAEEKRIRERVTGKGVVGAITVARRQNAALKKIFEEGGLDMSLGSALSALDRGAATARVIGSSGKNGELAAPGSALLERSGVANPMGEGAAPATGLTGRRAGGGVPLPDRREAEVVIAAPAAAGATVTGGVLDKKDIYDVVMRNKGAIRYCYESQLMRFPTLRGQVVVDFIIEPNGSVQTASVPTNTLSQAEAKEAVASCLIRQIRRWIFPKPQGGKVRVIWPFTYGRARG